VLSIAALFHLSWNNIDEPKELSPNLLTYSRKRLRMTKEQFRQSYVLSGNVEVTDSSILSALKREVKEETGFEVVKVHHELEPFHYLP